MTSSLRMTLLASSVAGLSLLAGSAALARMHYDDRSVEFSRDSGGYCDNAGCPDHFWRYPVHYGPVFFAGHWFKGPVYFRGDWRDRQYWVRGGWHRDEWRGPRPYWARAAHDGPPLAFEYYADHGFRLNDQWRRMHDGDRGDWNGGDHHDHGGDWNRDRGDNSGDWRGDHGGQHDDNGGDWHRDHGGDNNGRGADNGRGGDRNGQDSVIRVTSATYGGATCHQPQGNVTKFLAAACDGKKTCDYAVQYQAIGDPAPGCAKDFTVQWTCSMGAGGSTGAPAEAGLGSHVALTCGNQGH
jgi:hypothetical protein